MNIPKVDDLVKIFKDNNWTPQQCNGAELYNIMDGKCCAVPAIVKFLNPDFDLIK